ncbi:MAG: hypothetical protein KGJ23_13160 [Euryarchaeota archaeon]|nr:hypothetical protein [Euryarchaeota archaeon]MDE1837549.1 hypothetical protein [Euryarchaeota archaeon]MDE1880030.1 hypothetical protein [Euryarchaeota archaeon]MDE2046141.1 hypothetical protein [Thermoplasmata archaeon]
MARIKVAVLDAGPIIHLEQIEALRVLTVIREPKVTEEVCREVRPHGAGPSICTTVPLEGRGKNLAELLVQRYGLGLGEASAIALAKQEGIRLLFTDDLEAREVAMQFELEPHGTLALVVRSFREGVVDRGDALGQISDLHSKSTLYLTADLVEWARREVLSYHP